MHAERLILPPQKLSSIPKQERALLFVMGHALNELNVLNKLFLLTSNFPEERLIVVHAHVCQGLILSRALTGKLHETWQAIQKGYLQSRLSISYNHELEQEAAEALAHLKKYFGKKNLIETVRNSFAFHYSLNHAAAEIPEETQAEELCIYFGQTNGNTLYQFAEYAMGKALLDSIDPKNHQTAFDQLIVETSKVVSWLNILCQGLIFVILERHAKITDRVAELEKVEIGNAPKPEDILIPFFLDYPSS